ncbi:MAG TPA: DUF3011 domain-containing protein [Gemmatimonadales bacterium]|nr:DUF3011 domain-containing protein [Gemmatimonadales bacterium]
MSPRLVTCESIRERRRECAIPAESVVRLLRRLGPSPCDSARSWGRRGRVLWVDDGCRATFSVVPTAAASVVSCGAEAPGRQECRAPDAAEVVLLRQLGEAACVRGRTWGLEAGRIWTEGGCRAEFEVRSGKVPDPAEPVRLLCASDEGRRAECAVPGEGRVVLIRQLSRAECARGRSWGVAEGKIWVVSGCRGEFEVRRD